MGEMRGNPQKIAEVVINEEGDVPAILNPTTGKVLITNEVGKRFVELADGSLNLEGIVEQILQEFTGAEKPQVLEHAEKFFSEATEKGIVAWTEG